jgi:DNA-binding CsgD family transcriptional regulator
MGLDPPEDPRRLESFLTAGDGPLDSASELRAADAAESLSRDDLAAILLMASTLGFCSSLDACTEAAVGHLSRLLSCELSPTGDGDPLRWLQDRLPNPRRHPPTELIDRWPGDSDGLYLRIGRLDDIDVMALVRQVDSVRALAAAAVPSSSRRFGRRDRAVLDTVRPLLAAASSNALARQELAVRRAVAESTGSDLLSIDRYGILRRSTPSSVEELRRFFPRWRGTLDRLPVSITALVGGNGETKPLVVRAPGRQMVLQRVRRQRDGGALLHVQRQRTGLPIATMVRLGLSRREAQIVALVIRGQSNSEIAQSLGLSRHTVKTHLERILEKLGVHSRTEVAVAVVELAGAVVAFDSGDGEQIS